MSKNKLGGGIDALLGSFDALSETEGPQALVAVNLIEPNPNQPRKFFDEEALKGLADSIKTSGVLQPVLLEKNGGSYIIVAGERRYRAALLAGLTDIPAIVRDFTPQERLEAALLENVQREDLRPVEEAQAYAVILRETGMNQQELAGRLGKSRSALTNALRLLQLPLPIQEAIDAGLVSAGHARALLAVKEEDQQKRLFDEIVQKKLSVRETEKKALEQNKKVNSAGKQRTACSAEIKTTAIERRLKEYWGDKAFIKGSGQKGRIEIGYRSGEELKTLIERLTGVSL